MSSLALEVGVVALLLAIGLFAGRLVDFRHLRSLRRRELRSRHILVHNLVHSFPDWKDGKTSELLVAEVVISTDYLKTFVSNVLRFFGGELSSYGLLMQRARREALLRLKEQARERGFNALAGVRMQTADIGGATTAGKGVVLVAILASATGYTAASMGRSES